MEADNLQTGFQAAVHPKARFYQLDIRDRAALDVLFQAEKIDGAIHFAASSQVGESMSDPLKYYDNNLHGTMALLQAMVAHGLRYVALRYFNACGAHPSGVIGEAHILALDYLLKDGENNVFNLGNGVGFTNKEVVDVAWKVTGHPIPAEIAPRRAGDLAQLAAYALRTGLIEECEYTWAVNTIKPDSLPFRNAGKEFLCKTIKIDVVCG